MSRSKERLASCTQKSRQVSGFRRFAGDIGASRPQPSAHTAMEPNFVPWQIYLITSWEYVKVHSEVAE